MIGNTQTIRRESPNEASPPGFYEHRVCATPYATYSRGTAQLHRCTKCVTLLEYTMRERKVSDKQHDDLKEEASLSFRANAADLASMLAIGEHIADLTRNIDPDSSVTATTSRAGIIRYAIRQVGHLVQTPAGRRVLTYAGRKELRDVSPRTDRL